MAGIKRTVRMPRVSTGRGKRVRVSKGRRVMPTTSIPRPRRLIVRPMKGKRR